MFQLLYLTYPTSSSHRYCIINLQICIFTFHTIHLHFIIDVVAQTEKLLNLLHGQQFLKISSTVTVHSKLNSRLTCQNYREATQIPRLVTLKHVSSIITYSIKLSRELTLENCCLLVQDGADPQDALSCRSFFRKRATNYRALSRKMISKDKAFYASSPPCSNS